MPGGGGGCHRSCSLAGDWLGTPNLKKFSLAAWLQRCKDWDDLGIQAGCVLWLGPLEPGGELPFTVGQPKGAGKGPAAAEGAGACALPGRSALQLLPCWPCWAGCFPWPCRCS
jgi:hypothetical protein